MSPSPLPTLLALEALMNIFGATSMLLYPSIILEYTTYPSTNPSIKPTTIPGTSQVSPTSTSDRTAIQADLTARQLLQLLAALIYGLTLPMLWALLPTDGNGNGKGAGVGERRRTCYVFLLAGEVCLVFVLLWLAFGGLSPERGTGVESGELGEGGFTERTLMGAAVVLGVFGVVRLWILVGRGEWFGVVGGDGEGREVGGRELGKDGRGKEGRGKVE